MKRGGWYGSPARHDYTNVYFPIRLLARPMQSRRKAIRK
jgi:hypothetical protein